jgi:hypothetical protein
MNLYAEYLDVVRFPSIQETQLFFDFHHKKYDGLKIDLVIAIGPHLVPIIERFGDGLFPSSPVVLLDLLTPGADPPAVFRKLNMTGVFPVLETRELVDAALSLHPDTKHLVIVSGKSEIDRTLGL